jgi:hypothetical protein
MNGFEDYKDIKEGDLAPSLHERSRQIKKLIEIDYAKVMENIT